MDLWILTEERPKKEVLIEIVNKLSKDKKINLEISTIKIRPEIKENRFTFKYLVEGIKISGINNIYLKIISGNGSFVDYLIFLQKNEPDQKYVPIYAIEETKTSDLESRNTGVYQRCSKFVYADFYYPNVKKIMLYNLKVPFTKKPTATNIFGTRMLLTLGVEIWGKKLDEKIFKKFESVEEFIAFKNQMRSAPKGNVPIQITQHPGKIVVSGRLFKAGGLSHDPNIGALSIISKTLRKLGWDKDIVITKHGLSQGNIGRSNKFIQIANKLNIKLSGLSIPNTALPKTYWHYEEKSEKLGTIFVHLLLDEQSNVESIYENHAGCERGYFKTASGKFISIHKYITNIKSKGKINIPDLVICDHNTKTILNIEGKTFDKALLGIKELKNFDPIEKEYIKKEYPDYNISRRVVLYGGQANTIPFKEIAFHLTKEGKLLIGAGSPEIIKSIVAKLIS